MLANYHTHTYRCRHASGTPQEYIEQAIKNGIRLLGFSDHVPYPFRNGHQSGFRMECAETADYVQELVRLREKYKKDIQILIGYEAEYYPDEFDAMLENICRYECDYLILGQHFTRNEYDGVPSSVQTEDKAVLIQYVDQVIAAVKTGKFSYIAHPDLILYRSDMPFYEQQIRRLCECAKEASVPLEINLLGLTEHRAYPFDSFWEIAAQVGNQVVIGCDAHTVSAVGNKEAAAAGLAYAAKFGIKPLGEIKLRKVK